jgi:hypothetical protein
MIFAFAPTSTGVFTGTSSGTWNVPFQIALGAGVDAAASAFYHFASSFRRSGSGAK